MREYSILCRFFEHKRRLRITQNSDFVNDSLYCSHMSNSFSQKREKALAFIKKTHKKNVRKGSGVPDWHHLDRVSQCLEFILAETKEGTPKTRESLLLAALGHDALEDTDVAPKKLAEVLGGDALPLIEGMTNRFGDDHPVEYVQQIVKSEEAVRLIKLSDLYDNCTSVIYNMPQLGKKWTEDFFLPIVNPMMKAVLKTSFKTYPETAAHLKSMVQISHKTLLNEFERLYKKPPAV